MGLRQTRSAIVAPFRLPAVLEAIRRDHVDNAPLGVPAHVTVLFPFVPPAAVDDEVVARAAAAVATATAFEVQFAEVASWDPGPAAPEGVVWLPPQPPAPFIALTAALVEAFPGYLPYEGLHDEVIPHLTLANRAVDVPGIEAAARPHLPFRRRLDALALLVEDEGGRWRSMRRLPLATRAGSS